MFRISVHESSYGDGTLVQMVAEATVVTCEGTEHNDTETCHWGCYASVTYHTTFLQDVFTVLEL
jgi:hypothetical protein